MELKQYDDIILKDGREAVIVELFETGCIVDVGNSPETWETIWVKNEEIQSVKTKR